MQGEPGGRNSARGTGESRGRVYRAQVGRAAGTAGRTCAKARTSAFCVAKSVNGRARRRGQQARSGLRCILVPVGGASAHGQEAALRTL